MIFCLIPLAAGVLIAAAIPTQARGDYLTRIQDSPIDWIILGLGTGLFVSQTLLGWQAMQWRGETFNERSLFLGTKAPATARSVTPSYVYSLSRDALDRILMRFPEAASPVCKWIVERYTCGV